jgi:hypothetical protein
MMVKKLAKRRHVYWIDEASKASTDNMYVNPLVILKREYLRLKDLMIALYLLKLFPLLLKTT